MTETMVEARGLTRKYNGKVVALDHLDLKVNTGEWLALMGPSGSGKTTLLHLVACLDRPTSGELFVAGQEVSRLSGKGLTQFRRDTVGLVFQQFHLIPYLTALENVMLAQYFHSMVDRPEAEGALEQVGMGHRLHHLPAQLSGGEKQRVCIARALVNQPRILLADEPTGNLDEANEETVLELLKGLHRQGHTVLVATHDPVVAGQADRILKLEHGRAVQRVAGSPQGTSLRNHSSSAPPL